MTRTRSTSLANGLKAVQLAAILLAAGAPAACDRRPAAPAVAPGPATLPVDHPAIGAAAPATQRLPAATVLATVGDEAITAGDVDLAIAAMPGPERLEYSSAQMVQELVELLVDRKLLARAMAGTGPQGAIPRLSADAAAEPPGEAAITAYYRDHAADFTVPARVRVTRATAATAGAAENLRRELAGGATVARLKAARAASADEVWLQEVPGMPAATAVALALQPGEVSRVVPVTGGFLVMRADQVEDARQRPLEEVRTGIQASLEDAARQADASVQRQRLRKDVRITLDRALIASYAAPATASPGAP